MFTASEDTVRLSADVVVLVLVLVLVLVFVLVLVLLELLLVVELVVICTLLVSLSQVTVAPIDSASIRIGINVLLFLLIEAVSKVCLTPLI